jgi:hypothetical protein
LTGPAIELQRVLQIRPGATLDGLLAAARSDFAALTQAYPNIYDVQTNTLVRETSNWFSENRILDIDARCRMILQEVANFAWLAGQPGNLAPKAQSNEIESIRTRTQRIGSYAWYKNGQRLYLDGSWLKAADSYRRAIELHSTLRVPHLKAQYYLAYSLYMAGSNTPAALEAYAASETVWTTNKATHYYLGLHRYQLGDLDAALAAVERGLAVPFEPTNKAQARADGKLQALRDTLLRELAQGYNPDNYYTFRYSPVDAAAVQASVDQPFVTAVQQRLAGLPPPDVPGTTFHPKEFWDLYGEYVAQDYKDSGYSVFDGSEAERLAAGAAHAMNVWRIWAQANEAYINGFFSAALESYDAVGALLSQYWRNGSPPASFLYFERSQRHRADDIFTLADLQRFDWTSIAGLKTLNDYLNLFRGSSDRFLCYFFVEFKLMILHRVLLPLARAETFAAQDRFAEADSVYGSLLGEPLLNTRIETPYVRRRQAENLLAWADTLYKVGQTAATGQSEGAADKYLRVMKVYPEYVQKAYGGQVSPTPALADVLPINDPRVLPAAKSTLVPAVNRQFADSQALLLPLLASNIYNVGAIVFERQIFKYPWSSPFQNPLVLRLLRLANIGLMKLRAGMNFLGYTEDYIPIWRYSYLIERARYFADRARTAERDVLNFFEKGYSEEEKAREITQTIATQNLSLRIADAKIDEQKQRVQIAQDQVNLFDLRATNTELNAQDTIQAGNESAYSYSASVTGGFLTASVTVGVSYSPGAIAQAEAKAAELRRSITEMRAQQAIARKEKVVAQMEQRIAELNRDVEALNLAFAQDNLNYLKSRPLNREFWFALGRIMRQVAQQYLQQAITIAWLAEQAYEYEYDKRLDVVKLDYSNSSTENMLAADMLLGDLDSIEYDRLSTVENKEMPLKLTLSLSELDPIGFQSFQRTGLINFATTVESLDLKFPGTYLARVKAVEVRLNALVGRNEVIAGRLTHNGISQFRFRKGDRPIQPPPTTPDAPESFSNIRQDYIAGADAAGFALRIASQPSETMTLSNFLVREDGIYFSSDVGPQGQRLRTFEDVGFAGEWTLEISPSANDFDFRTIMDAEITFYLTARYDEGLHFLIDAYHRGLVKSTIQGGSSLTAGRPYLLRYTFPDAFYELHNPAPTQPQPPVVIRVLPDLFAYNHQNVQVERIYFYVGAEKTDLSNLRLRVEHAGSVTTGVLGGPLVTADCGPPVTADFGRTAPPFELTLGFLDQTDSMVRIQDLIDIGVVIEYRYDLRGLAPVIADIRPREAAIGDTVRLLGRGFDAAQMASNIVKVNGVPAAVTAVDQYGTELQVRVPAGATTGPITIQNVWGSATASRELTVT